MHVNIKNKMLVQLLAKVLIQLTEYRWLQEVHSQILDRGFSATKLVRLCWDSVKWVSFASGVLFIIGFAVYLG
jgi:hypothetical protein